MAVRKQNLKKYGLTLDEYSQMLEEQNHVCAVCKQPETSKNQFGTVSLAVDHCHETGLNRGLLCMACNRSIGMLGEDVKRIESVIEYLKKHKNEK